MKRVLGMSLLVACLPVLAGIEVPDVDPITAIMEIIANFGIMSPLALASAGIVAVVQVLKKFLPEFKYKRFLVVVLGVAYGVVQSSLSGLGLVEALVLALITSGGAVAIYEALKPLLQAMKRA